VWFWFQDLGQVNHQSILCPQKFLNILKKNGFDTTKLKVHVFEALTTKQESEFIGSVKELEGKEFSDLTVMVFNQTKLNSYLNFMSSN